jgi:FlaA1/EpsC-like NDP-sugar epimerase
MIKLYGMIPGKDIEIIYTGPRFGEKINEDLVTEDEELIPTEFEHIYEAKTNSNGEKISRDDVINILFNIEKKIQTYDYENLFKDMKKVVPNFDEKEMWYQW